LDVDQAGPTAAHWKCPLRVNLDGHDGEFLLSGAPLEVCVGGRSFDGDVLVSTILDARSTVCVNVMDFAPVHIYGARSPRWWPDLFDALLAAVSSGCVVRVLVAQWAHTSRYVTPFLGALESAADALAGQSSGRLEVRRFTVPRRDRTGPKGEPRPDPPAYPGHTRVNHLKVVVTDRRVNIGTSNMTGDYFSATAGTSINVTHAHLVAAVQATFDRDWAFAAGRPPGPDKRR
jgi:phospholipase D3/4